MFREKNSPVAVFDSGIGGITVLAEALKQLPDEDYLYFADTKHVPYGSQSKEAVRAHVLLAMDWIVSFGVKAIVVACNTATSVAIEDVRRKYDLPVIGMEPAVKPAVMTTAEKNLRVLVLATPLTLKEEKFRNLLLKVDPGNIVDFLPMPELVQFAEQGEFDSLPVQALIRERLADYQLERYGTIVLGCTHFPFFKKELRRQLPAHIIIIDGNEGTVRHLKRTLDDLGILGGGSGQVLYVASGEVLPESVSKRYRWFLDFAGRG